LDPYLAGLEVDPYLPAISFAGSEFDAALQGVDPALAEFTSAVSEANPATAVFRTAMAEIDPVPSVFHAAVAEFPAVRSKVNTDLPGLDTAPAGELTRLWIVLSRGLYDNRQAPGKARAHHRTPQEEH
jgi:hypothetical protein